MNKKTLLRYIGIILSCILMPYLSMFIFAFRWDYMLPALATDPFLFLNALCLCFYIGFIPMWFINYKLAPVNKKKIATYSVIIAVLLHTAFLFWMVHALGYSY